MSPQYGTSRSSGSRTAVSWIQLIQLTDLAKSTALLPLYSSFTSYVLQKSGFKTLTVLIGPIEFFVDAFCTTKRTKRSSGVNVASQHVRRTKIEKVANIKTSTSFDELGI